MNCEKPTESQGTATTEEGPFPGIFTRESQPPYTREREWLKEGGGKPSFFDGLPPPSFNPLAPPGRWIPTDPCENGREDTFCQGAGRAMGV